MASAAWVVLVAPVSLAWSIDVKSSPQAVRSRPSIVNSSLCVPWVLPLGLKPIESSAGVRPWTHKARVFSVSSTLGMRLFLMTYSPC